jgi:NTP pyrophosphatase (non-canonical NTP hydrolase)
MTKTDTVKKYLQGCYEPTTAVKIANDLEMSRKSATDCLLRLKNRGEAVWDKDVGWYLTYKQEVVSLNLLDYVGLIQKWAKDKNIHSSKNRLAQSHKVLEESLELQNAILHNNYEETKDAIGDVFVTIVISAMQNDVNFEEAVAGVYDIISKRTGKTVNGLFIKD